MKYMLNLFLFLLTLYIALVVYLYVFQRRMIYYPDTAIESPEHYGLQGFSEHLLSAGTGQTLQLWHHAAAPGFPTLIYFHGNAAHLGNRAGIYNAFAEKGFGVLALSYRGYGKSTGSPDEQGLYEDARSAIAFLTGMQHIPLEKIMLFGESLGTGVAVHMATEYKVGALILQAPYTSVAARAAELYSYIPVNMLIRDRYDSLNKIRKITCPLLLFHGERDGVIPVAHGRVLYEAAPGKKQAFFFPHISHNDFDSGEISAHVLDFAVSHQLIERP